MKIVILDADTVTKGDIDFSIFNSLGDVTIYGYTEKEDVAERIGDAEIVFCNKSPITSEVISKCPNVQYIGLFSTGFNNVDLKACDKRDIIVTNVPGYSTDAVAQHVFAFILSHFSRVNEYAKTVAGGDWVKSKLFSYFNIPTQEISGLTLGIIGFGSIGNKVALIAQAFGMKVCVYTQTIPDGYENIEFVTLDKLLKISDVVTLHCPLTEETQGLINYENLSKMKKDAILINTSRGPVVNENDLNKALKENVISKAYLDVISVEPMLESNPLRYNENCIITPHIAWAPHKTRVRLVKMVIDNFLAFKDKKPINVVNKGSVV